MKVSDYILNGRWNLPDYLIQNAPMIAQKIMNMPLPLEFTPDKRNWTQAADGELTNKLDYSLLNGSGTPAPWCKLIWY